MEGDSSWNEECGINKGVGDWTFVLWQIDVFDETVTSLEDWNFYKASLCTAYCVWCLLTLIYIKLGGKKSWVLSCTQIWSVVFYLHILEILRSYREI